MSGSLSGRKTATVLPLPIFTVEGDEYYVPENLLQVDIERRDRRIPILDSSSQRPAYLTTCYDEFSRNFVTASIASSSPSFLPVVPYNPEGASVLRFPEIEDMSNKISDPKLPDSKSRILHHYDPSFVGSPSTFKSIPPDTKHFLGRQPHSDCNLLCKILKVKIPEAFEPLFGSITLFTINSDQSTRLSETFHFDMTPQNIRMKFKDAYKTEDIDVSDAPTDIGLKVDPATNLKICCFNLPTELKRGDLYVIIQVYKILTGDPEKALLPYIRSTHDVKIDENYKRLSQYRQLVGAGGVRVCEDGKVGGADIRCQLYGVKNALNDLAIGQVIFRKHTLIRCNHLLFTHLFIYLFVQYYFDF
jgi:hypothetical protein